MITNKKTVDKSKGFKFVISGINPKAPWKFTVPIIKSAMKTTGVSV